MGGQLLDKILKCDRLPSFPAIAARVIEMCGDPDVSIRELGEVLSHDTAISTKILRTVNSSYYGLRNRVTTVERATTMLGINTVKMLALGFSLVPQLKGMGDDDFDPTIIWKRSLYSAVGAHTIARQVRFNNHEEAFIAGLLQDLGVIVMLQALRGKYVEVIEDVIQTHGKLRAAEHEAFDLDHTKVGHALAEKWNLPKVLITAIHFHETPDSTVPEYQQLVRSVALGAKAADCFISDESQRAARGKLYIRYASEWFNLDQNTALGYLEEVESGTRELGKLFEIDSHADQSASDLMLQANEALADLSVQSIHKAEELQAENQELSNQAYYDPLTSIYNRGGLDNLLEDEFARANQKKSQISIAFFDLDKFKPINDTYGHEAGDKMLQLIASVMNECAPISGRVGRYGGDEFVMVLPGIDGAKAATIAETIRQRIEQTTIEVPDGTMVSATTVSVGISSYLGLGEGAHTVKDLTGASDKAMYAAKKAGGNRIYHLPPIDQPIQKAG